MSDTYPHVVLLQLTHPVYGRQIALIDERDAHLARNPRLATNAGPRWVVDRADKQGGVRLARAIAELRVARPSPAHTIVGYRNDSPCDMRAANLYWRTPKETMASKYKARRATPRRAVPSRHSPERGALG